MSLKDIAREWVRSVAANYLGRNIRRYTFSTYVGEISHNSLGGLNYLRPQEGTVADVSDQFTLLKVSANSFCVILNSLLSQPVNAGAKVRIEGYQLRRFDGLLADGSEDPASEGVKSITLTGTQTMFPVNWEGRYLCINERFAAGYRQIQNPYLRDLIKQCETIPVNGGLRRIVNILVDANGRDLDFVDPPEEQGALVAPAIKVNVATKTFVGLVEVFYNRPDDMYGIRLTPTPLEQLQVAPAAGSGAELNMRLGPMLIEDITFDELGDALLVAIDDEKWAQAKVTVLKPAPKKRLVEAVA